MIVHGGELMVMFIPIRAIDWCNHLTVELFLMKCDETILYHPTRPQGAPHLENCLWY